MRHLRVTACTTMWSLVMLSAGVLAQSPAVQSTPATLARTS